MNKYKPGDSLSILVADDDEFMRLLVSTILKKLGHSGVLVDNGKKLLACLAERQFDVLVIDVMMPVMDGMATLAAIRRQELVQGGHQRIIMATAHTEQGDRQRLIEAGADGYISKPILPNPLQMELQRVMLF